MISKNAKIVIIGAGAIGGVKLGELLANRKIRKLFSGLMREAMAVAATMNINVAPAGAGLALIYFTVILD